MIFSPLPPGDGLPVGFPRVIFELGDDEAMAMTVDELLKDFEALDESEKLVCLNELCRIYEASKASAKSGGVSGSEENPALKSNGDE